MKKRAVRIAAVALRHFYLLRGSAARLLPLFIWVALDIVLWGFITRYLHQVTLPGIAIAASLIGGILLWDFFVRVMQGVTTAFFEDVWSRNFLNIFASPLSPGEYIAGLVISSILTSLVGLIAMLLLAGLAFGISFSVYGMYFAPFLLVLFLFGIALGMVGCALVLRFGPAAEWFIWPIPAMLAPFAGVFYPLSTLPHWMQSVGDVLPPAYVFEGMRGLLAHHAPTPAALLLPLLLAAGYIFLGWWGFVRVYRHALKTGLIARYSAESVG